VRRLASLALPVLLIIAGCGSADQDKTPVACLGGPGAFTGALQRAPGEVTLSGNTLISDCIVTNQSAGELANVGVTLVKVGTDLNAKARANPQGPATVQLGFLLGAVVHGASDTGGIHVELVRRLSAAARYSPSGRGLPAVFRHEYEKGYAAGQDHG
jgi:hypothetical protein